MAMRIFIWALIAAGLAAIYAGPAYAGLQCPPFCVNVGVPEPSSVLLLAAGAGSLAWYLRKRR
jgi:hypothetical protein